MDKNSKESAGARRHDTYDIGPEGTESGECVLPAEEALEIVIGDVPLATLHCTPENTGELVLGFLLGQGYVDSSSDISSIESHSNPLRAVVRLRQGSEAASAPQPANRVIYSGCGQGTVEAAITGLDTGKAAGGGGIPAATLRSALEEVLRRGELYRRTRGIHSAGLYSRGGERLVFREDIGRHNAGDKVLGWLAQQDIAPEEIFFATSGRVSVEAVHKVVRFGIPVLFSKGVPTSLAVADARRLGLTLASSLGPGRLRVYCHGYRVKA